MNQSQQNSAQDLEIALQKIEETSKRLEELKQEADELVIQARKIQAAELQSKLQDSN